MRYFHFIFFIQNHNLLLLNLIDQIKFNNSKLVIIIIICKSTNALSNSIQNDKSFYHSFINFKVCEVILVLRTYHFSGFPIY